MESKDVREQAVHMAMSGGVTRKVIAQKFGIGMSTLNRWVQQERRSTTTPERQQEEQCNPTEVSELRRENELLRELISSLSDHVDTLKSIAKIG
ncbi:transposase [Tropicimonas sp. TH_r6]|uniref:transposase n=1 Tax=Tropicimonas sp. TH_r6 TaxID=3082085 RepID=UPI0029544691|nr:transposase [Tropicimonas sp. TH_r6]MDV7144741.1 transposase [Tropicimonas sp. TH_r6]